MTHSESGLRTGTKLKSQHGECRAVAENAAILGANSKRGIAIVALEFGKVVASDHAK
jgi:hypothetical protein